MPRKRRVYLFTCEQCNDVVERSNCNARAPRFCSKSCSNRWQHKHGLRRTYCADKTVEEWRDMHRTDIEVIERKRFKACEEDAKAKRVAAYKECHPWTGKSLEERLGSDRAKEVRQRATVSSTGKKRSLSTRLKMSTSMHTRMLNKPETITSWGIKGWYKGFFFRSSYECFFMKKLESEGISVRTDVVVEPFRVPYVWNGEDRTYIPDVFVPSRNTVYEVKSTHGCKDPHTTAKADAASVFFALKGMKYELVTERDMLVPPAGKIRAMLKADPCVFLLEKVPADDTLTLLFSEQRRFMDLLRLERGFPEFPVDLSTKAGQKLVKDISHECMDELFESIHLLKDAKNHRKTVVGGFDREAFLEELADVLHYLIEVLIVSDISPEELYKAYMRKGTINFARILGGY